MENLKDRDCMIIKKDGVFLVGKGMCGIQWRWSMWDAWRTQNRSMAYTVARKVGGQVWHFNPISGSCGRLWG